MKVFTFTIKKRPLSGYNRIGRLIINWRRWQFGYSHFFELNGTERWTTRLGPFVLQVID